jgi:glycosyltransferase involved in cell wall biosynthesis
MISVVYCTRQSNQEHKEHLIKSSGLGKNIEIIEIVNNGESLTTCYNRGLKQAKHNIIVYCHDDLVIETKSWGDKLIKLFKRNPEFGIIGVAGTKYLSQSGKWWENPKKMYGRVAHTHEGKTWLSTYSADLGHELEEVVVCDGVWFAVDKTKIKKTFNENVEGFHFYDVTFSFENYIAGSKVGVTTAIRINHKSIGMTNEAWEKNRVDFSEAYQEHLPANIKRKLRKGEKLKVLLGCLNFSNLTGSELYVFELAKQLVNLGCDVSICSTIGNPLASMAKSIDIKLYSLQEPPSFKLGDGKWMLKSPQGDVVSQPNTLYKISNLDFDIIHLNHKPVTEHLLRLFPNTPVICSIHSEIINLEEPVISPQIKKYIAIRPEIKEHMVNNFKINSDLIEIVYNPIDSKKFKPTKINDKRDKKRILFVGTIDYLRKETIKDLINTTAENDQELWLVGKLNGVELSDLNLGSHVTYFPPSQNIEDFIHKCDETAGILLGRTTIEGWLCGKKGWIYDVDSYGDIISKKLYDIPSDIDKFKSENVVKQIMILYENILE